LALNSTYIWRNVKLTRKWQGCIPILQWGKQPIFKVLANDR
jgi:hypothetical protein